MKRYFKINGSVFSVAIAVTSAIISASQPVNAAERVGVSAAVRGDIKLITEAGVARQAAIGSDINFNETVTSGTASGLQIMLLDETTFSVGEDAEITIDEMVYDPSGVTSRLLVNVAKGSFRYLSGEIAKQNPDNVKIETPFGNIGIRGTNLFAVQTNGDLFVGLLGPGLNNNTGDKPGGFIFSNEHGTRNVLRSGFGLSVAQGQSPGEIIRIPPEIYAKFERATVKKAAGKSSNGSDAEDTSATDDSGQGDAETKSVVSIQQAEGEILTALNNNSTNSASATLARTGAVYEIASVGTVKGHAGSAVYSDTGVRIVSHPSPGGYGDHTPQVIANSLAGISSGTQIGTYDFSMTANFTARTISPSYSNVNVPSLGISNKSMVPENSGTFNYSGTAASNNFIITPYDLNAYTGGHFDGNIIFLKTSGSGYPVLYQDLNITGSNINDDIALGGSLIAPQ